MPSGSVELQGLAPCLAAQTQPRAETSSSSQPEGEARAALRYRHHSDSLVSGAEKAAN